MHAVEQRHGRRHAAQARAGLPGSGAQLTIGRARAQSVRARVMRARSYLLLPLLLSGCVDELVVGLRQPLQAEDGGLDEPLDASEPDDASTPEASTLLDATPEL